MQYISPFTNLHVHVYLLHCPTSYIYTHVHIWIMNMKPNCTNHLITLLHTIRYAVHSKWLDSVWNGVLHHLYNHVPLWIAAVTDNAFDWSHVT